MKFSSLSDDDCTSTALSKNKKQSSFPCDKKRTHSEGRNKIFYLKKPYLKLQIAVKTLTMTILEGKLSVYGV